MRLVINIVGEPAHGLLAESRFVERSFLPGGEHNMYELAFAAAGAGYEVELRGWLDRPTFDRFATAVGSAPLVDLPPRMPTRDDLVVVPEGWRDPLEYLRLWLSPARLAIFVLAPPGLFGWPFASTGWTPPDPLTVPLDAVARPEHFRAMHGLGFTLLTHSPGIVEAVEDAGVPCAFVGTGRPNPPEPPSRDAPRPVDAVALSANRWEPLVSAVAADLGDLNLDLIEEARNEEVMERLARARVLIWPSRIEGHATIPWEARSVGCVPVALSTNRFAVGLRPDAGVVLVDEVEAMAAAVQALLADERRWHELSTRATATAPLEVAWGTYTDRVARFLEKLPHTGADRLAAAGMGDALSQWLEARAVSAQALLEELNRELARVRDDRTAIHEEEQRVREDRDRLALEVADAALVRADRDRLAARLDELETNRAVRLALRLHPSGTRKRP